MNNIDPLKVYEFYINPDDYIGSDPFVTEWFKIKQVDEFTSEYYIKSKYPFMNPVDIIVDVANRRISESCLILGMKSVINEDYPKRQGVERMQMNLHSCCTKNP
jgi:hypothetical protein